MILARVSTCFCLVTNASENSISVTFCRVRRMVTPFSALSSTSKLAGALSTMIRPWFLRFSFSKVLDIRSSHAPVRLLRGDALGDQDVALRCSLSHGLDCLIGRRIIPATRFLRAVKCDNHDARYRFAFDGLDLAATNKIVATVRRECFRDPVRVLLKGSRVRYIDFRDNVGRGRRH